MPLWVWQVGQGCTLCIGTPSSGAASSKVSVRHGLIGLAAGRGCAGDRVMHSVQSKLPGVESGKSALLMWAWHLLLAKPQR